MQGSSFFQVGTHWIQNLRAGKNCRHKSTDLLQMQKLRPKRTKRWCRATQQLHTTGRERRGTSELFGPSDFHYKQCLWLAGYAKCSHPRCYFQAFQSKVRFSRPPAPLGLQDCLPPSYTCPIIPSSAVGARLGQEK